MSTLPSRDSEAIWEVPASLRRELLAALSTDPARETTMTVDEFLDWVDEDILAEWVDGRIVMSSPASDRHQMLVLFLGSVLESYTRIHDLGIVRIAPFYMKLAHSTREPDVLFLAAPHIDRLYETYLDGPADLVIEITSPESRRRDHADKFYEYREAGIPEYWIIDPDRRRAELYQLESEGQYVPVHPDVDGIYRSSVLEGFWLNVGWLWEKWLPDPMAILLTVDRDAYTEHFMDQRRRTE